MMAASTPSRSAAVIVTSAAISGVRQISSSEWCLRTAMYSGMYRPACRRNQTGVRSTGWRKQARTKRLPFATACPCMAGSIVVEEFMDLRRP